MGGVGTGRYMRQLKLEDVTGQQDEMETAEQRRTRLQVFPLSDFPCSDDESDENDS